MKLSRYAAAGSPRSTTLKTGERPETVRPELECHLRRFLPTAEDWLLASPKRKRWSSEAFADRLRELNRKAKLPWTTQDFRHTFADEIGTSIAMLILLVSVMFGWHIAQTLRRLFRRKISLRLSQHLIADHELLHGGRAKQRRIKLSVQLPMRLILHAVGCVVPAHRIGERR